MYTKPQKKHRVFPQNSQKIILDTKLVIEQVNCMHNNLDYIQKHFTVDCVFHISRRCWVSRGSRNALKGTEGKT